MAVFSDSWARLGWVESLAARVLPAALAIDEQGRRGNLQADLRSCEDHDHIRYTLVDPIAVPVDLGFLIADLATNARSCLDMAIEKALQIATLAWRSPCDSSRSRTTSPSRVAVLRSSSACCRRLIRK